MNALLIMHLAQNLSSLSTKIYQREIRYMIWEVALQQNEFVELKGFLESWDTPNLSDKFDR